MGLHGVLLVAAALLGYASAAAAPGSLPSDAKTSASQRGAVVANPKLDRSGKARKGKASYNGRQFYRKKMANGKPLNPNQDVAASKTLPLGTVARVTNLNTGKSDVVTIEDRGPYVKGRIVDVSPKAAEKLDLKKDGVAPVEVKPLAVPVQKPPSK